MNIEIISHKETWPKNPGEINKYLSLLEKKIWNKEEKESHNLGFYKEVADNLRKYGIENIKNDINKSTKKVWMSNEIINSDGNILVGTTQIKYTSISMQIEGKTYTINFYNGKSSDDKLGKNIKNNKEIFINLSGCEESLEDYEAVSELYSWNYKTDIYTYISGIFAHEEYHNTPSSSILEEEANADARALKVIWEPYLIQRLWVIFDDLITKEYREWNNFPQQVGHWENTELFNRYAQSMNIILQTSGKQVEFENIKKPLLSHLKTWWIEKDWKKEKKYTIKDWIQIREWYYRDNNGIFKEKEYNTDIHKGLWKILTPEILKQILVEYQRLSKNN